MSRFINVLPKTKLSEDLKIAYCRRGGWIFDVKIKISNDKELAISSNEGFQRRDEFLKEQLRGRCRAWSVDGKNCDRAAGSGNPQAESLE